MKFFSRAKDGGPKSTVTGFWLIELKWLFSIVLLRFAPGSRDEYHDHAFNALSWVFGPGALFETVIETHPVGERSVRSTVIRVHERGVVPIVTKRSCMHRVSSSGTTWVLSFRGPWSRTWREYDPKTEEFVTLTNGRKVVSE